MCFVSAKLFSVTLPCSALDNIYKHQNTSSMTLPKYHLYSNILSEIKGHLGISPATITFSAFQEKQDTRIKRNPPPFKLMQLGV